jgi:excisionase family DNA binding protein
VNLISVPDAAKRIGCSRNHLYNLVAAGKLTRYNVGLTGKATRVSDEDVDRFIAESAQPVRPVDEAS